MLKHIGNTPMIKIKYKNNEKINYIYTKLESYNPTGSIKDRVAYYMINKAKERGKLKENMPIVEATSGNTGISLSAFGAYFKQELNTTTFVGAITIAMLCYITFNKNICTSITNPNRNTNTN